MMANTKFAKIVCGNVVAIVTVAKVYTFSFAMVANAAIARFARHIANKCHT